MIKKVLVILGLTLTSAAQAQTTPAVTDQVRLPGQHPGVNPQAARTGEVSQLQQVLAQNYGGGAWTDVGRQTYLRYHTATLPGLIRAERKNGANWVTTGAHRYQYNTAGEIQSDTTDQYVQAPAGAYAATVSAFNTPSQVRQQWHTMRDLFNPTEPWDTLQRSTYTYNAAGQRTQRLEESYAFGSFEEHSRHLWTYNSLGQITVYEIQSAPNGDAEWGPLQRFTYTYNAAGKMQQFVAEIINIATLNSYVLSSRHTLQYDAQGRESVLASEERENDAWLVNSQTLYAYNPTGDLASATLQGWDGSAFQNVQRLLFTYAQVLSAHQPAAGVRALAVVPNPSTPDAPAQLLLEPGAASATGAVYDHLGRRVAGLSCPPAQAARGFLPLPAGLPAGLYVVRLQTGARQWQARWDKR
ncbi:hypothetical protein [uncultured Hymenobacter sp.]|uniref:hypothetical protein n=1 Tax=uncultured Hymenobacter sp. TaxID=170016 RepID=UPI0035C9B1D5